MACGGEAARHRPNFFVGVARTGRKAPFPSLSGAEFDVSRRAVMVGVRVSIDCGQLGFDLVATTTQRGRAALLGLYLLG